MKLLNILVLLNFNIGFIFLPKNYSYATTLKHTKTIWQQVVQKLEKTPNTFLLHSPLHYVPQVTAAGGYENAKSYIAIDESTGTILAGKNATTALSIASLTKIMSAVVALDLVKPTDEITISHTATTIMPTTIGVVEGQKMTVDELLHAMLMTSANDAAVALADGVDAKYGQNIFVQAMNEKAHFLGLRDTHFSNPEGLDEKGNKSSSYDLALLTTYALSHYPQIGQIVGTPYAYLPANAFHKQFDLYNWNGLLGTYPGTYGVKIGNTTDALYTTITGANRNGKNILVVLLGAPGILQRDMWTANLLDDTFSSTFAIPPAQITQADLENKYSSWKYWN